MSSREILTGTGPEQLYLKIVHAFFI